MGSEIVADMTPDSATPHLPRWLKRNVPKGNAAAFHRPAGTRAPVANGVRPCEVPQPHGLLCSRRPRSWFLGATFARVAADSAVAKGKTREPDPSEPQRVAEASQRLGLRHVVTTMVTRDDLPDGGGTRLPHDGGRSRNLTGAAIEVLPSDFAGNGAAVDRGRCGPGGLQPQQRNRARLYREVRGRKADYRWTLDMFRRIKRRSPAMRTKTGLMLGLGETEEELLDVLADLLDAGCEMLTLGQYLQPTPQKPVRRPATSRRNGFASWVTPPGDLGFQQVAAGPFVRSSYMPAKCTARWSGILPRHERRLGFPA